MKIENSSKATTLRQNAEEQLSKNSSETSSQHSETDYLKLNHELQVHQIELEMQNEELILAKEELILTNEKLILAKEKADTATQKYAELYDFAPMDYFTLSKEGEIIDLNLSGAKLLGKKRSNLLGGRFGFFVSEDTRPLFNDFLDKVFTSKTEETSELKLSVNGNSEMYVQLSGIISENGKQCFATLRDINLLKKTEDTLKFERQRLASIIEGTNVGTWEWNVQTGETVFNERWAEFIGYTLDELSPVSIDTWIKNCHPEDLMLSKNLIEKHFKGELDYYECESRMKHKNGDWIWVLGRGKVNQWDGNGKPLLMSGTHQVITERKKAEKALKEKDEKLVKLNADKDLFMSILGHDLRSPFFILRVLSELLQDDVQNFDIEEIKKMAGDINKTAQSTFKLLEDILLWARIQQGKIPFKPQIIQFQDICINIFEVLNPTAAEKNITINNTLKDQLTVIADANMLKTILRNLVSNAIKFTNIGGSVNISAVQTPSIITISVTDSGVGISHDNVAKLFDVGQVQTTYGTADEKGTGLGLLLCKEFVEKHSGRIWVESEVGIGSSFKFTLPIMAEGEN